MLNYHEMTMNEPKDSPQKRKQFAVTCTIMGSVLLYMLMTSGAFQAIDPIRGKFPGGSYIYKYTARDYASSGGLGRSIMEDLIEAQVAQKKEIIPQYKLEDQMHHIYLDNPSGKGGSRQRFMSGLVISKSKTAEAAEADDTTIDLLLSLNHEGTKQTEFSKDELHAMSAMQVFAKLPYETADLPAVEALVLQFPWTGGVSSMLVQSMKIIPRMHKIAAEQLNHGQTVVVSVCSKEEQMCTHYAPLVQVEDFLLGRPTTFEFNDGLPAETMVDWKGLQLTLEYGARRFQEWFGLKKKQKTKEQQEQQQEQQQQQQEEEAKAEL
ncbi:MAG: hypothetical protein SGBAC_005518 [Bacillariaceae sp.]